MTTKRTSAFAAVPRAFRSALQWRLLLLWVGLMLIPTMILGVTMWKMLGAQLDYSARAAEVARQIDLTVFADLMAAHGKSVAAFSIATMLTLLVTLLLSPLLSGMAASAARAPAPLGFRGLWSGALAEYPRMLRMMIWSLFPLGLAMAVGSAAMEAADDHVRTLAVEADGDVAAWLAMAVMALLFALAHATLDLGRAVLALDRRRSSAVKAWWAGCKLLLRRPLATLGVYLAISIAGLALAGLLVVARINVAGIHPAMFAAALLLVQLTVATIGWMRSARLFAMVELARSEGA